MTAREVILEGGSPWGFRMHGGADVGQPLRISRVNPGSKASQRGVREGDIITSINGQATRGLANTDAHSLLRGAGHALHLGLNQDASPKRRSHNKHQQQSTNITQQITPEVDTSTSQPCSTATTTIVVGCSGNSDPGAVPPMSKCTAATPASSQLTNQQQQQQQQPKAGTSSPQRTPPNTATNTPIQESTKSHKSSSGGGRQKRSRRLKARKKALKEAICEPKDTIINEPLWEELCEINPIPNAVHASPLLSAEALCLSDDVEPRPDIPTVEELKQLLSIHLRIDDIPKKKTKLKRRAETFPPSLRRLEVIAEEDDNIYEDVLIPQTINQDESENIYEDVELQHSNTNSVFRAEQCYIYSDSDEEEKERKIESEYVLLPCRVIQIVSDDDLSDNSINKQLQDAAVEIIEVNDNNKVCDISEELYVGSPVNIIENNEESVQYEYITSSVNVCETYSASTTINNNNNNKEIIEISGNLNSNNDENIRADSDDNNSICLTDNSSLNVKLNEDSLIQTLTAMNSSQYEENYETLIEQSSLGIQNESFYDEMIETLEVQEETNREVRPIYHTEENLNQLQMKLSQKKTQENEIKETDNGNSSNIYQPESQPELEINSNRSLQSQENEIICSNVSNIVNKFEINNTNICNKNKEIDNSECNIDINDTKNNSNEKYTSVNCENLILTDVPHETNKQFLNTDETVYKVVENSNVFIYTSIITTESHSSCTQNNFVVLSQEELQNQTHIDTKDDEIIISEFNSDEELEQQINLEFEELYNTNYPEEISSENNICTQEFTENIIISDYNVDDKFNLQEEICINSDTLSHERSSVHIEEIENETIEERRPNFEVIPSIEITKCEYENDDIESEIVDTETIKCKNDESISENEAIDLQNIENVLDIRESKEINNKYKEAENISDTVENEIEINRKIIVEEDFTKIDENKTIVCEKYINGEIIPEIVKNEQINKEYIDCENVNKTMENEEINAQFTKQEDYTENIQNKEINAQFTKQEVYTENIQNEEINTQFTQQEDYTENIQNEEINAQFTKQEDYTENIQNEEINTQFTQQEDYTENIQNEEINAQFTQQEDYNENIQNEEINAQFTQQEDYTENIQNEEINAQFTKQEVYSENIGNDFENEEICPEVAENEENEYEIIDTEENTTDEYQYEIEESNREIVHNELSTNEDETDEGENKENNYPETEIFKKEIIQYDQESVIKIERENDIISSESIINEYNNITENVLQSMSFVTNKLAHILQVTDQAASILNQKLPETNTIVTAEVPAICNENTLYTSLNEDDSNLQDYNLEEREFSLSEKTDSTYQLRQFLKSIREDMNNGIEITPTHSRSESIDSNCSLNTTVYCDVKSNNSSSSLSLYFNNSCISGTQPKSLRKLCLDVVAQFPNGLKLMLDWGLATVEELDLRIQPKLNLEFTPPASTSSCSTTHRSSLPATSHAEGCCSKHGYHGGYDCSCWLSVPAYGPYFVCLSPAQQKILPQNVSPEKAAALLDLHYKVSQRRAYHEPGSHQAGSQLKMGLNEDQQEQHLKASILSDWLAQARFEQQQPQLRAKSPLTRFEKLNEESNMTSVMKTARKFEAERYHISKQRDIAVEIQEQKHYTVQKEQIEQEQSYENDFESELNKPCNPPVTENEIFREQMFSEYQQQMAERAERRQNKILRVSEMGSSGQSRVVVVPGAPESAQLEVLEEFANRARKRMEKLGISEEENEMTASILSQNNNTSEMTELQQQEIRDIFVLEGGATQLPKRIQEDSQLLFSTADKDGNSSIPVLAPTFKATAPKPGVWSPKPGRAASASAAPVPSPAPVLVPTSSIQNGGDEPPPPPVWTPKASPTLERKEFRPVRFDATTPPLKLTPEQESVAPPFDINSIEPEPPLRDKASSTISSSLDRKLTLNIPRLPRAQNPTVTLLQKAREGQLPRGALYLDHKMSSKESEAGGSKSTVRSEDIMYTVKKETVSDGKKTVELSPKKYDGIGPTTKDGIPIVLRSGIKEENYGKWYKRMYDSLHKAGRDDDHITIRYRPNRRGYPYSAAGGYASEPEPVGGYDSDIGYSAKYATLDRRRIKNKDSDFTTSTMPRSRYISPSVKYACEVYKNQPGRIEDYEPGHSSISDKEAKLWWDEVMDIFDGDLAELEMLTKRSEAQTSSGKPFMTYALKESGYESDSQLVFKRRDESSSGLSPTEHKQAYKVIQSGGEVPLHGLRKPAPERPKDPLVLPSYYQDFDSGKESPHKFVDCGEVTIHYRSPVRGLARDAALSEEELARRQEEAMRRIYQEERRRKYLQELHDMESRRHTDNFTPSQKSPIPLNRYDDFFDDVPSSRGRDRTPEPKMVARALYNFVGQSPRELTFRRGDIIIVRRQIDKNWYEGEHNASIGLFPFNYVEIIPYDGVRSFPKGPLEGKARAKFNFVAQTHLELSLVKGENVVLTRRVDDNWYEGRIGARKGIFPVSYVEVIQEPGERLAPISPKPVASPASHSLLLNGSASSHQTGPSQRPHQYNPYSPPSHYNLTGRSILAAPGTKQLAPVNQTLHIDTHSEPVPYRALYNYKPQNDDELELREGDTVFVMEKCDDGWYVGSSHRSGHFGTFPGNYVERV